MIGTNKEGPLKRKCPIYICYVSGAGRIEGYSALFFFLSWQWMKRLSMNELLKIILRPF
jgi:hypothetical protein